jgi:hypothetical protein
MKTFEEFLNDKCECHTNNSPEGFERWLEQLDGDEYMVYADEYGKECWNEAKKEITEASKVNKYSGEIPQFKGTQEQLDALIDLVKN